MNPEHHGLHHDEAAHHTIEPVRTSASRMAGAMSSRSLSRPVAMLAGVALCIGLASCVGPYDSYGGGSLGYRSYSPGYSVNSLPGGYRKENISGSTYYYHDGHYYRRNSGGYVVVEPPRSSRYYNDYTQRQRRGQSRHDHRQTSSRRDSRHDGAQVVTRLPRGYREINHRGNTYYQAGDRYYSRRGNGFIAVSSPY